MIGTATPFPYGTETRHSFFDCHIGWISPLEFVKKLRTKVWNTEPGGECHFQVEAPRMSLRRQRQQANPFKHSDWSPIRESGSLGSSHPAPAAPKP